MSEQKKTTPEVLPVSVNLNDLSAARRREFYVMLVLTGLVFRKDGAGSGAGLASSAITYVDSALDVLAREQ